MGRRHMFGSRKKSEQPLIFHEKKVRSCDYKRGYWYLCISIVVTWQTQKDVFPCDQDCSHARKLFLSSLIPIFLNSVRLIKTSYNYVLFFCFHFKHIITFVLCPGVHTENWNRYKISRKKSVFTFILCLWIENRMQNDQGKFVDLYIPRKWYGLWFW